METICSIIISVLESYEVVRRQLLHFDRILPEDWELILMDDGSNPPIRSQLDGRALAILEKPNFRMIETLDTRSWSQPAAFNRGVREARGKYIFISDIDHIITRVAIDSVNGFEFHKMTFPRTWGVLNEEGEICTDVDVLVEYGLEEKDIGRISGHANTFVMLREDFLALGGYNEAGIGECTNIDNDLNRRYGDLAHANDWKTLKGEMTYVYPNPRDDKRRIFHGLRRWKTEMGSYAGYKKGTGE